MNAPERKRQKKKKHQQSKYYLNMRTYQEEWGNPLLLNRILSNKYSSSFQNNYEERVISLVCISYVIS